MGQDTTPAFSKEKPGKKASKALLSNFWAQINFVDCAVKSF
jgi:hypothetical protein